MTLYVNPKYILNIENIVLFYVIFKISIADFLLF